MPVNFPIYIFYEILIRLSENRDNLGDYLSRTQAGDSWIIRTTTGRLFLEEKILHRQFADPDSIKAEELDQLANTFEESR